MRGKSGAVNRRTLFATIGGAIPVVIGAGCLSSITADESGTVRSPDDAVHNFDVETGQTVRVKVDNQEGVATYAAIHGPDREDKVSRTVKTEDTLKHEAGKTGVYRVYIIPADGRATYEIYIED